MFAAPPSRSTPLDRRRDLAPRALYLLAGGLGLASLALAAWGWRVGRQYEDQLDRAARVQAELLAREFTDEVRATNDGLTGRIFSPVSAGRVPWDARIPEYVLSALREARECKCVAALDATGGAFWWTSTKPGRIAASGMDSAHADAMRRSLERVTQPLDDDRLSVIFLKVDSDGRELFAPVYFEIRDGVANATGFVTTPAQHAERILAPAAERVQRRRYGDAGDRITGWRVMLPSGDTAVRLGSFDAAVPAVSVAFFRPRFQTDSSASGPSFVAPASPVERVTVRGALRQDPRVSPYRLLVQVHPRAIGAFLYGTSRGPTVPVLVLVAVTLALTTATLVLARRFVQHVREREAFATAVAHDLRTPLTQILLYGESLQLDRPALRTREEAARVIVRETRRLIHLVENALHFVRGGRARPSLRPQRLDLGTVIRETIVGLQPVLDRARVLAQLSLASDVAVDADRDALAQVLTNLIDNAVRFGPAGQTLSITLRVEDERAVVELDDEGPGIPTPLREEVFKPFVRAGRSQGTGIGLAVSRQLVELMDGHLFAMAAPSGGARLVLTMRLPASTATHAHSEPEPHLVS